MSQLWTGHTGSTSQCELPVNTACVPFKWPLKWGARAQLGSGSRWQRGPWGLGLKATMSIPKSLQIKPARNFHPGFSIVAVMFYVILFSFLFFVFHNPDLPFACLNHKSYSICTSYSNHYHRHTYYYQWYSEQHIVFNLHALSYLPVTYSIHIHEKLWVH